VPLPSKGWRIEGRRIKADSGQPSQKLAKRAHVAFGKAKRRKLSTYL